MSSAWVVCEVEIYAATKLIIIPVNQIFFRFLDIFMYKVGFRGKKWDQSPFSDIVHKNTILTLM